VIEEVLGFCALVLTVVGLVSLSIWFCCSIVERIVKMRRRLKNSRYNALLKENERLRSFLVDVEENSYLREVYYSQYALRKSNKVRHNAA
jgi:hypothetical protein